MSQSASLVWTLVNFVLLQWFFIRFDPKIIYITKYEYLQVGWHWIGPVIPLTGWVTPYRWLKR